MLHSVEMTEFFLSLRFFVKSKIGELRDSKSAILTNWEALKFEFWWLKFTKSTNLTVPKMAQLAILELLDSPKLISRKIKVTEKSWNFHTVEKQETYSHKKYFVKLTFVGKMLLSRNFCLISVRMNFRNFYTVHFTVWKFQNLSAIQILREITFGHFEAKKTAI